MNQASVRCSRFLYHYPMVSRNETSYRTNCEGHSVSLERSRRTLIMVEALNQDLQRFGPRHKKDYFIL